MQRIYFHENDCDDANPRSASRSLFFQQICPLRRTVLRDTCEVVAELASTATDSVDVKERVVAQTKTK